MQVPTGFLGEERKQFDTHTRERERERDNGTGFSKALAKVCPWAQKDQERERERESLRLMKRNAIIPCLGDCLVLWDDGLSLTGCLNGGLHWAF